MSWHYLQGQEEASSEAICWDGERFAPSSGPTTLGGYCLPDSETESCLDSRSGMMSRPSTEIPGEDESMSSQEDSHARTSAQPGKAQESTAQGLECGSTWQGSFARYDPASRSWKTAQFSLLEGLDEFSETWSRWGSTRNMEFWERSTPERRISESGSGLWPTIRAQDGERGGRGDLIQAVRGNENTHYRLWQTPVADDAVDRKNGKWNSRGEPKLSAEVLMWPTPTANCSTGAGHQGRHGGLNLQTAVKWAGPTFPTPLVGSTSKESHNQISGRFRDAMKPHLPPGGGQLNPDWVEWLMGWPIGWTACEPLEMDKFQQWPRWHSGFFQKGF